MSTVVLYNCPGDPPAEIEEWRRRFAALDPAIQFRAWPDTGPVDQVDFILAWMSQPGDLTRYHNAKAIFWLGAGVDHLMKDRDLPRNVPIVRLVDPGLTAGMSEYVVLHVLRYHRRLPEQEALQRECHWRKLECSLAKDRKVGIMGLGVLGGDALVKLAPFGFDLAGWSRSPKRIADVATFHGEAGLTEFLKRTEILVCLLPLTPATAGIMNESTLALLPRGACVINAARGGHVVESELIAALDRGQIGHATLDVFHAEPLPVEHPFWRHPGITVTPHVASVTMAETAVRVIHEGMIAARAGKPLKNVVDLAKGY